MFKLRFLTLIMLIGIVFITNREVAAATQLTIINTVFRATLREGELPNVVVNHQVIAEHIQNGSFTANLSGWKTQGRVEVAEENTQAFVRLGRNGLLSENWLGQDIELDEAPPTFLYFEYRVMSEETLLGFDQPCFQVKANDQLLFERSCHMAELNPWQHVLLDLSTLESSSVKLSFWAGNTVDNQQHSWVELRDITTQVLVLTDRTALEFTGSQAVSYRWNNQAAIWKPGEVIFLDNIQDGVLTYWPDDQPLTVHTLIVLSQDLTPLMIENIGYYSNFDGTYTLLWNSPAPDLYYEVRVADEWSEFYKQPWENFPKVILQAGSYQSWLEPVSQAQDKLEIFQVSSGYQNKWLGIKTRTATGSYSDFPSLVELK